MYHSRLRGYGVHLFVIFCFPFFKGGGGGGGGKVMEFNEITGFLFNL